MALAARPTGAAPTPNFPSGPIGSGGRNVASVSFAQIDELAPKTDVQPDANFLGFSNWQEEGRRGSEAEPPRNLAGQIDTPSATFVSLLSQEQDASDISKPSAVLKGAFRDMLSQAIRAYEGTSEIIHGAPKVRGTSLSMSL